LNPSARLEKLQLARTIDMTLVPSMFAQREISSRVHWAGFKGTKRLPQPGGCALRLAQSLNVGRLALSGAVCG
ncbi:unnamed protein product, partial [Amoebophrya sp. A25]